MSFRQMSPWKAADGTGSVERLTESSNVQYAYSFSADGETLVFRETQPDTRDDLRMLSLAGDRAAQTLVATQFVERNAELSPDGRWMAYQSNASGQVEIYVRPFPAVDREQWMISTSGGTHPLWSPDGQRFLMIKAGDPSDESSNAPQVIIVENWFEELKRLAPTP